MKKLHDRMSQLQTAPQAVIKISQDSIAFLKECNKLLKSAEEKLEECDIKFEVESDSDAVMPTQVESLEVPSSERGSLSLQSSNAQTTLLVEADERMDIDIIKISYKSKASPASSLALKGSLPRSPSFTTRVAALAEGQSSIPPSKTKVNV